MFPREKLSLDIRRVCEATGDALRELEAQKRICLRQHISAQRGISPQTYDHWGKDGRPKPADAKWLINNLGEDFCVFVVRHLVRRFSAKTLALLFFQAALMAAKNTKAYGHDPLVNSDRDSVEPSGARAPMATHRA